MDLLSLFLVALVLVLAGLVKGVTAMGLPTLGMGLLSLLMPPAEAAAILLAPTLLTNIVQFATGPRVGVVLRRFWLMALTTFLGTLIGGLWFGGLESHLAPGVLGATLFLYGLLGLGRFSFHTPAWAESWLSPVMGVASGLLTGTTGVTVMPAAPYLQSLGLEREDLVQAMGLSFSAGSVGLAIALSGRGAPLTSWHALLVTGAALIPAFLGMEIGRRVRMAISQQTFRNFFFAGLSLLGANTLVRAVVF
ncbi:membrane protein [Azorhizobium oxalatiphilum]|uniref:Probable membrane transporter protein n=1 Tax=Azorhizobium oxalatiphilum TaxID=980631 RepID=A0A917C0N4_9HYPH|nr:sulfite exporter TauE/SafE family protein [Azorhizobium oxalatiphilum]GGF64196.1 membrane protein [Azorhizobium oxalatiphilum]